ncbi:S24 family peptidase [Anthocerotibacter panamensis]|uniref:S24 family peptidase n=1 Tax=Anthocerotibacter panamensis TaxID=2857077 RepID=UPI001C405BBE|nr:S24 family peptidase [Anthocerotibacter panamensis]
MSLLNRELQNLSPLGREILSWMRSQGLSLNAAATLCRISAAGLKKNMLAGHQAEHRTLQKIAQGMAVPIERVEALARGSGVVGVEEGDDTRDLVMIPRYAVEASAGSGTFVEDEQVEGVLALNREMIRGELHARPGQLVALYVKGDSMEPVLRAGDVAVIDQGQAHERTDGIYVVRINGSLLIKSLQWLPGGRLKVKSENPAYETYVVNPTQDEVHIVGRVVWAGRKF